MSRKKKILLVDDSRTSLFMEQMILKKEPYDIITAGDGLEAVEKAEKEHPDLILMDVVMPGQNGFQLTRAIARHPQYAAVDRKSTRLNSSHLRQSRMPSSA